ncbi:hypothetical protein [Nitrospina gracilis]|uniref:hypothetical protein n=1 Tax=Nitrospina gracilis TaxID=35801 RepID=UPI001F18FC77|nr:hypothetical protein [Nitrospina gracilis]MCF8719225.1 hypothetical protein [Nitrospina gracilis Nb-211]
MSLTQRNKIERGEVLRVVYRNLPEPIGDNVLAQIFTELTVSRIQGHLRYLQDGGYLAFQLIKPEYKEYTTAQYLAKITKKGVDLLEGNIEPDPGIVNPGLS